MTESGSSDRAWYRFRYRYRIALVTPVPVPVPVRNSVPRRNICNFVRGVASKSGVSFFIKYACNFHYYGIFTDHLNITIGKLALS